ncbi:MAG: carboxypeptidase-like regulatory domain-containing protein [Bacteroidetes bacterium]|nr:carboxypeptidase-like regulatory domain-containing protein [Bacteroidota bacterium]
MKQIIHLRDQSFGILLFCCISLIFDCSFLSAGNRLPHGMNSPTTSVSKNPFIIEPESFTALGGNSTITGHVYIYGSDSIPIHDATITITDGSYTYSGITDFYGFYLINSIEAGTYTLTAEADGYVTQTIEDVVVGSHEVVTVDFYLMEFPIPPLPVTATLNDQKTEAFISWYDPVHCWSIVYDDDQADNATAWLQSGSMNAIRFTHSGYPFEILNLDG